MNNVHIIRLFFFLSFSALSAYAAEHNSNTTTLEDLRTINIKKEFCSAGAKALQNEVYLSRLQTVASKLYATSVRTKMRDATIEDLDLFAQCVEQRFEPNYAGEFVGFTCNGQQILLPIIVENKLREQLGVSLFNQPARQRLLLTVPSLKELNYGFALYRFLWRKRYDLESCTKQIKLLMESPDIDSGIKKMIGIITHPLIFHQILNKTYSAKEYIDLEIDPNAKDSFFNKIPEIIEFDNLDNALYNQHLFSMADISHNVLPNIREHVGKLIESTQKIKNNASIYEDIYKQIYSEISDTIRCEKNRERKQGLYKFIKYQSSAIILGRTDIKPLPLQIAFFSQATMSSKILYDNGNHLAQINKPLKKSKKKKRSRAKNNITLQKLQLDNAASLQISDNKKKAIEQDFKPIIQNTLLPMYSSRVMKWFNNDFIANQSDSSIAYHKFTPLVDKYLFTYGVKEDYENKSRLGQIDTRYSLLADIVDDSGKKYAALVHATVNNKHVCYHRGIEKNIKLDQLLEKYIQLESDENIESDLMSDDLNRAPIVDGDTSFVESEDTQSATIRDNLSGKKIILYKNPLAD